MPTVARILFAFVLVFSYLCTPQPALAETTVSGPIISDTSWTTAGNPYHVTGNVFVPTGVTLTIQPGVIVKFDKGFKMQVEGALIARGTSNARITFTSSQAAPIPGDWDRIEFTANSVQSVVDSDGNYQSGSVLQGCVVEYAGATAEAVTLQGTLMDNCIVRYSYYVGVIAYGANYTTRTSWVTNSLITENNTGVVLANSNIVNSTISNNKILRDGRTSIYLGSNTTGVPGVKSLGLSKVVNNVIANNWKENCWKDGAGLAVDVGGTVTGNVIRNNFIKNSCWLGQANGAGIATFEYLYNSNGRTFTISDNIIAENTTESGVGGGIYWGGSSLKAIVSNNSIVHNVALAGAGVYVKGDELDFLYNTIVGNTHPPSPLISPDGGLQIGYPWTNTVKINYNTIYGNQPQDVVMTSENDVDGANNYFGATSSTSILSQIYDFYDDSTLGKFNFVPYLSMPDATAPLPPPINLSRQRLPGGAIKVSWSALPSFNTGWGYKVYYNTSGSFAASRSAESANTSPVDVGSQTSLTFDAPVPRYVAVTAYDNQGHESWYSVTLDITGGKVFMPMLNK